MIFDKVTSDCLQEDIWTAWSLLSGLKCRGEDEFSQLWWLCACVCLGILFLASKWPTLTDYGYFESKNLSQIFLSQVYYEFFDLFFAKNPSSTIINQKIITGELAS